MTETPDMVPVSVPEVRTAHRVIQTPIPPKETVAALTALARIESRSMQGELPILWDSAEGSSIFDASGNQWIDFTSTIFVMNVGHANERVRGALMEVLERPLIHTYAYSHRLRIEYLERLIKFAGPPFEKAFLLSSGTEATEAGLKLMRMNGERLGKRRPGVVCIDGNWHGRTLGAQMMAGNPKQKSWIGYHDPNVHHIPFPYPWQVDDDFSGEDFLAQGLQSLADSGIDMQRDICGFMLETFQGWGAVFYPTSFVQAIRRVCDENDALLTFDEMQSGFGRTGKNFGFEHYGVTADLICCGKGMGSVVPLSGVIGTKEVMDLPGPGSMSSTHSGNPLVCAAGLATLMELDECNLVDEAARKGTLLHDGLRGLQQKYEGHIGWVLGRGMIAAIVFTRPEDGEPDSQLASAVAKRCMQKGLLVVRTGRESVKIGPPLVISDDALLEGLSVLDEAIGEVIFER